MTAHFWATICKTVLPILLYRCPVMSVTLVYCGQTVGWIKKKLGMQVGLSHIVLDGYTATPKKGHTPNFRPMSTVAKQLDGSRCHLVGR